MTIAVGSSNPVKINAVVLAASETWPEVKVIGEEVASGINEQPFSDAETRLGAKNRAREVYNKLIRKGDFLGVGLEGGVTKNEDGELWSTVWAAVWDGKNFYESSGARFKVPALIAEPILAGGEMGPILSDLFDGADVKRKSGAIGIITKNFVDRTQEYAAIAKLALGLWYGRDWQFALEK